MAVSFDRKLLKWGNGFGIRLTAAEARELQSGAGDPVHVTVEANKQIRNDLSKLPRFDFGGIGLDWDWEDLMAQDLEEKLARRTKLHVLTPPDQSPKGRSS